MCKCSITQNIENEKKKKKNVHIRYYFVGQQMDKRVYLDSKKGRNQLYIKGT